MANTRAAGYCANGIHHIGDAEECWRCAVWEHRQMESHVFSAAVDAHLLAAFLRDGSSGVE